MLGRALVIGILASLLWVGPGAAEEPSGAIRGQLVNKTQGGGDVSGQRITLKTFVNEKEGESKEAKTDQEGKFQFTGLPLKPGSSYQATVNYQGADYEGDRITFAPGEEAKNLELAVYNPTTSEEAIKVNRAFMVVSMGEGTLMVAEYIIFNNQGDKTYVGARQVTPDGKKATLRFSLPQWVKDLQYFPNLMDSYAVKTGEGVVDTKAMPPGVREAGLRYQLDLRGSTYDLSWPVLYPTDGFDLLIKGEGVRVASEQLTPGEIITLEGRRYQHFSARGMEPNTTLVARLSGLPVLSLQKVLVWGGAGLALLAAAFALSYPLLRRRQPAVAVSPEARRRTLLLELARLDDDLEAGAISPENHQRLRQQKKAQLLQLLRQARGKGGG